MTGCLTPCSAPDEPSPVREDRGEVEAEALREASGLVASRANPGVLWSHNDSGDAPRLFAMTTAGVDLGTYSLAGATHVDWEDIAVGPGSGAGHSALFVGDIGDNDGRRAIKTVYRVPEPRVDPAAGAVDAVLGDVAAIRLRYPGGPTDAESLLVDPTNGDLYIVTKRARTVIVLRASAPHAIDTPITMDAITSLTFDEVPGHGRKRQGAVGGDVAPSGRAVLLKTYDAVWLWRRAGAGEPLFGRDPQRLPYVAEPQGEAITWAADGAGFFTLSEERKKVPAHLYYYALPAGVRDR